MEDNKEKDVDRFYDHKEEDLIFEKLVEKIEKEYPNAAAAHNKFCAEHLHAINSSINNTLPKPKTEILIYNPPEVVFGGVVSCFKGNLPLLPNGAVFTKNKEYEVITRHNERDIKGYYTVTIIDDKGIKQTVNDHFFIPKENLCGNFSIQEYTDLLNTMNDNVENNAKENYKKFIKNTEINIREFAKNNPVKSLNEEIHKGHDFGKSLLKDVLKPCKPPVEKCNPHPHNKVRPENYENSLLNDFDECASAVNRVFKKVKFNDKHVLEKIEHYFNIHNDSKYKLEWTTCWDSSASSIGAGMKAIVVKHENGNCLVTKIRWKQIENAIIGMNPLTSKKTAMNMIAKLVANKLKRVF